MLKKQNFSQFEVGRGGLLLYLDQEEGDPVGLEGTGKFHVANFGFDLTHVPTVLVGLQQQRQNIAPAPQSCLNTTAQPFRALPTPPAFPAPARIPGTSGAALSAQLLLLFLTHQTAVCCLLRQEHLNL